LIVFPVAAPVPDAVLMGPNLQPEFPPEFGKATWYGEKFHGQYTASGEIFDMYAMTAAHRRLPMGSLVRVMNVATGRAVLVRVNDRGPLPHAGMVDLSYAAAEQLGIRAQGHAQVRLDLLTGN